MMKTTATETTNETTQARASDDLRQAYEQLPEPEKYSDVGDAALVEAYYATQLRHSDELGWMHYHHGRWDTENGEKTAKRAVLAVLHQEATEHVQALGRRDGKELFNHLHTACNRVDRITGALAWRPNISAHPSQFDTHHDLLNCANGVVNLRDGTLTAHNPALYMTKQSPYAYRPEYVRRLLDNPASAQDICPRWLAFLHDIFLNDSELIGWMQKVLGYWMTGQTSEHAFFILHGGGRNGKSQLILTLHRLLGGPEEGSSPSSYATRVTASLYVRNKRAIDNTNGPTPEMAKLEGARMAWGEEPESNDSAFQLAGAHIKDITGGSTIPARKLYRESYSFTPHFKAILAVNHLPRIVEDTDGMASRIWPIPFKAKFEGANDVKDIHKVLLAAEAEGILAWCVAGAVRWYAEGLGSTAQPETLPRAIRAKIREYSHREQPYYGFFHHVLRKTGNSADAVPLTEVRAAFDRWHADHADEIREALRMDTPTNHWNDLRPLPVLGRQRFSEMLGEKNYTVVRRNQGMVVVGVTLAPEQPGGDDDDEPDGPEPGNAGAAGESVDSVVLTPVLQNPPTVSNVEDFSKTPPQTTLTTPAASTTGTPLAEPQPDDDGTCAHPATARMTVMRERVLRCALCGETLGPAETDGVCAHARALIIDTPLPDAQGLAESTLACPDCGHRFACAEPASHRATWDALGCPVCDAAWREREGPDLPARRKARIQAEQAERTARETRAEQERAEWQDKQAAKARRLTEAEAAVEAAEAAFAAAFGSPSAPVRFVREALSFGLHDEAYGDETPYGTTRDHLAERALNTYNEAQDAKRASEYGDTSVDSVVYVADRLEAFERLVARGVLVPGGYTLHAEGEAVVTVPVRGGYTLAPAVRALGRALGAARQELWQVNGVAEQQAASTASRSGVREYTFTPATEKQQAMLRSLGYDGDVTKLAVPEASRQIDWHKHGRNICMLAAEEVTRRLREQPEPVGMSN